MKRFICALILLITLCGCSATEPSEKYLVSGVGVEKRGKDTTLYYKITDISSSDRVGEQAVKILSAKGEDVFSAAENINLGTELSVSLSHCEILFFSDTDDKAVVPDVLSFCEKYGLPLKMKLAVTGDMEALFSAENTFSGGRLSDMLEVVWKTHGFGGHTALFEIETAVKTNNGNFALPYFAKDKDSFVVNGLGLYENSGYYRHIGVQASREYVNDLKEEGF